MFSLGYETPKDARRSKLPSIRRISACKAGTDTPSSGESSKLPEYKEYAACPHSHLISLGAHLREVLCPLARAKNEPSNLGCHKSRIPERMVFEKLVGVGQSEGRDSWFTVISGTFLRNLAKSVMYR